MNEQGVLSEAIRLRPLTTAACTAASPAVAQVGFGSSVTVGDDEVFVGERAISSAPACSTSTAVPRDGSWELGQTLEAPNGTPGDAFGSAVAVTEDRLLVSAPAAADGEGAVYAFRRSDSGWEPAGTLGFESTPTGSSVADALAVDGEWAMVGVPTQYGRRGTVNALPLGRKRLGIPLRDRRVRPGRRGHVRRGP